MSFHQHLMSRPKQTDHCEILLHYVDAIITVFSHLDHFLDMAFGFLEIYKSFCLFCVHDVFLLYQGYRYYVYASIINEGEVVCQYPLHKLDDYVIIKWQ